MRDRKMWKLETIDLENTMKTIGKKNAIGLFEASRELAFSTRKRYLSIYFIDDLMQSTFIDFKLYRNSAALHDSQF